MGATALSAQQPAAFNADARKTEVSFVAPTVLRNISTVPRTVEVNLTAAPTRLSLRPGVTTDVFAYNGQIPGPTLDIREGDHVIIHFENKLSEPTTVHWHGLHIPADADG